MPWRLVNPGAADSSFGKCNGIATTGCERNLLTDPDHCGGCGFECPEPPNATASCVAGSCDSECIQGYSPCGESCRPDRFCLDDGTCVGGLCLAGGVGCNPGPSHCVCLETYAGPTICTPAFGASCSAQRCSQIDPPGSCPAGSYCIPTSCDGPGTLSGRCAPLGIWVQDFDCGTDSCSSGETCQADGICRRLSWGPAAHHGVNQQALSTCARGLKPNRTPQVLPDVTGDLA